VTDVSVVIPARDAAATIRRTLEAVMRQRIEGGLEVIVVDDGSSDTTAAVARSVSTQIRVVSQPAAGPAPARNRGAAEASAPVLAFTDADCFPAPGWLEAGLAAIEGADLVQGAVAPDPEAPRHPVDRTVWVVQESGLYETANLFVRRDAFERLGGFEDWLDPGRGKPLAEDFWFGWRLRRAGGSTRFCAEALVHHAVFPSSVGARVREQLRLRHFPAMAAKVPELREAMFHRRVFLSRDTARFDLAVAGAAAAAACRSPLPLLAAAPYVRTTLRAAAGWRSRAPEVVAATVLGDAAGLLSLLAGGVRARSPVL
jgi:cellulose synthase/poly-beta-1,6-N-acetylglucosamine synthase-like glycosyltransferase